jgi:hypothetical protein
LKIPYFNHFSLSLFILNKGIKLNYRSVLVLI